MSRLAARCIVLALATWWLAGCVAAQTPTAAPEWQRLRPGSPSYMSNSGLTERQAFAVDSQVAWRQLWSRLNAGQRPQPALPEVDFSRQIVIVAVLGRQRSGGYGIEIAGVTAGSEATVVQVRSTAPGSGCIVSSAMTAPVDLALMNRPASPLEFRWDQSRADCGGPR